MRPGLRALHPGNFAAVMATGILAIGWGNAGQSAVAEALAGLALLGWLLLLALSALRLLHHADAVRIDLLNPRMVFSFFTLVAATSIVGLLLHARGHPRLALGCWMLAFVAWCALLYLAFAVLTFRTHENNVNIVHGGWLIAIVGTQSLVVLGARIAGDLGGLAQAMVFEAHLLWSLGLAWYGIFITLFCYRIFFLALKPQDLSPLLWVVMGAAAISTTAGTTLLHADPGLRFLHAQRPFIEGVTLMLWAWATWWLPLLVMFFVWKHAVRHEPLRYEPVLWTFVFPLGMYAVASLRLGQAAEFAPLGWVAQGMLGVASLAWLAVACGLLRQLLRARTEAA
ncbi:tellurite resistance/C4-dicarboxylate transporter family protein [Inhella sp.]|uniref:tellurite resistance/C4-dicarboxylate transporter family protein n=1 Tax=Inhella sp. TaxID=1921806 RepID=UPI0035B2216B